MRYFVFINKKNFLPLLFCQTVQEVLCLSVDAVRLLQIFIS